MKTSKTNLREEFLKQELELYMKENDITDLEYFFSKTPEELMQLPDLAIQLISYIQRLKKG